MLTEKQVESVCEIIRESVSRETGISRNRVDLILDGKIDPEGKETEKILNTTFYKMMSERR